MISIDADGATMFLSLAKASLTQKKPISQKDADDLLSTQAMKFTLKAYENMFDLTRSDLFQILANLNLIQPYHSDPFKRQLEEGFRSCYNIEAVDRLNRRVEIARVMGFNAAQEKALKYLPPNTFIESTIYLTIDAFNSGIVRDGNVGLSLLSELEKTNMDHITHEFHHIGFMNCLSKRPQFVSRVMKPALPKDIALQLIFHLVLEGMANHFCSPKTIKIGKHGHPRVYEKIQKYEQNEQMILEEIWNLIKDCIKGDKSIEEYQSRTREILIDNESILPKIHFAGEKIISTLEEDMNSIDEIIDLCNYPENIIQLYARSAKKRGLFFLPPKMITRSLF